jgi:magnesium transporter
MIERFSEGKLTWIDLVSPTGDEIREVMEEANLPPELASDLNAPIPRSSAEHLGGVVKVTLDYPIVKRTDINHPHEIKLLATKTHLVSVHFEDIEAIHRFQKEFEMVSILKNTKSKATGGHLLNAMMGFLYNSLNAKLDYLESRLTDIEDEIFQEREKEMVFEISNVSRRIITFKHILATHERVIMELKPAMEASFSKEHLHGVEELHDQFEHLTSRIKTVHETLSELRETNMALLTTKQNEIMKIFTILAFITFPLTLFTSMFGMNTKTTPIVGYDGDFWIILGSMGVVSVLFFAFFKYKRWI